MDAYPGTSVETDVDGAAEQDEVAFRELEGAETGRDEIADTAISGDRGTAARGGLCVA